MPQNQTKTRRTQGTGIVDPSELRRCGSGCVIEPGVLIFHPENIELGDNVYIGHQTILKGYHNQKLVIDDGTWIGQQCFVHSAGGIRIGANVGIGPGVRILTSVHSEAGRQLPILHSPVVFSEVIIEDDADIGTSATILPGVMVGRGTQIGAGAVVRDSVPPYSVAAGVPAKIIRERP